MIRRDANFGWIVDQRVGPPADLAFVSADEIEDGEERLAGPAIPPVRLSAGFVPNLAGLVEVVILFRVVGRVIAGLAQVTADTSSCPAGRLTRLRMCSEPVNGGYIPEMMVVRAGAQTGQLDQA